MTQTIAVLGAGGMMGFPIARNLARAGMNVRSWNRTRRKAESLSEDGASVFDAPAQAAEGAEIVLTMLSDADAVLGAVDGPDGALATAAKSPVWVQMSTIGERGTERCMELARQRGVLYADCPVLGTVGPAQEGKLVVLASGPEELKPGLRDLFEAIGQRTIWVGEAGAGTRLKVVINSWIVSVVEGAAETMALAEGLGLDPRLFLSALEGGALDLPYLRMKGKAMIERSFEPSFRLKLAAKDADLAVRSARERGLHLPLLEVIRDRLEQGAREHGDEDIAATFLTSAPAS